MPARLPAPRNTNSDGMSDTAERIRSVTAALSTLAATATQQFGGLSAAQLNWKPAPKSWSVAQCFDHLITTHSLYLPVLRRLHSGPVPSSLWERTSPFSGFFGRFLIKSMRPDNPRKMRTAPKVEPSTSEIDVRVIERYSAHQDDLIKAVQGLPANIDLASTIVTSPLLGVVTYSLDDCLTMLEVHGQRHLGQAMRVMEMDGFSATGR